jgi:DNA-binding response OmpR family regulator
MTVHANKILLLEDHADCRRAMSKWFAHYGYCVVGAGTVAEAIARLGGQAIAFLDVDLPDGSGVEVLEHIRRQGHPMRVAFVTATHDISALTALLIGSDTVFRKPIEMQKLMDWISVAS